MAPTETSPIAKLQKKPKCSLSPPPTQQFGVSLAFIKENNANMVGAIPPVVRQCIEFLSQPDGKSIGSLLIFFIGVLLGYLATIPAMQVVRDWVVDIAYSALLKPYLPSTFLTVVISANANVSN